MGDEIKTIEVMDNMFSDCLFFTAKEPEELTLVEENVVEQNGIIKTVKIWEGNGYRKTISTSEVINSEEYYARMTKLAEFKQKELLAARRKDYLDAHKWQTKYKELQNE